MRGVAGGRRERVRAVLARDRARPPTACRALVARRARTPACACRRRHAGLRLPPADAARTRALAARRRGDRPPLFRDQGQPARSEEHTSELQSLMRISYAVFCLKTKNQIRIRTHIACNTLSTYLTHY